MVGLQCDNGDDDMHVLIGLSIIQPGEHNSATKGGRD